MTVKDRAKYLEKISQDKSDALASQLSEPWLQYQSSNQLKSIMSNNDRHLMA
jgi:hypothetical protein